MKDEGRGAHVDTVLATSDLRKGLVGLTCWSAGTMTIAPRKTDFRSGGAAAPPYRPRSVSRCAQGRAVLGARFDFQFFML
jgi:hypothetical protein